MAESLFLHEKIQTTFPKAQDVARFAEGIITSAKEGGLNAQRKVARSVHQKEIQKKLFDVLVPRYQSRNGGYTQIIRNGYRQGDAAAMAVLRLLA